MNRITIVAIMVSMIAPLACSMRIDWPRHTVDVRLNTSAASSPDAIKALLITVDSVELIPCDPAPSYGLKALPNLILPSAHAHGVSTETKLAKHHIVNLFEPSQRIDFGQWTPPPGDYCSIELLIASADQDAYNTSDYPSMTGQSVGVVHDEQNISLTNKRLSKRITFEQPLVFHAQGDDQQIRIDLNLTLHAKIPWPTANTPLENTWLAGLQDALQLEIAP